MAKYTHLVASRKRGCWTVDIFNDGSLIVTSDYKNKSNRNFKLDPVDRLVDVGYKFPGYLHRMVQEINEITELYLKCKKIVEEVRTDAI